MFLHIENQKILWQTLQRTPYLVEFTQKYSGQSEIWFKNMSEQFYTQWISNHGRIPTNAVELLEINKNALQFMVTDLKRLLGYTSMEITTSPIESYNVSQERQRREDEWSSNFNKFQNEYNQLLKQPAIPLRELPTETTDSKIKNMDELLREHAKMREIELLNYLPQKNAKPQSNKIRILDELGNIEMHINGENKKKTVRWLSEATGSDANQSEATGSEMDSREANQSDVNQNEMDSREEEVLHSL
jgi:hypothetical protein